MCAQEQPMSCAAACIRQIMADKGVYVTEGQVRKLAYTSEFGTSEDGMREAFRQLDPVVDWSAGFAVSPVYSSEEMASIFTAKGTWIAVMRLGRTYHSILVDMIADDKVCVRDPWGKKGIGSEEGIEGTIELSEFIRLWEKSGNLAAWRR